MWHLHFSPPTVRAAAVSAVRSMRLGAVAVSVLWAPAVRSAPGTLQKWPVAPQTWWPTCRSTASWSTPTSRACRADIQSETHDDPMSLSVCHQRSESLRHAGAPHADSLHSALPTHLQLLWSPTALTYLWMKRSALGQVSGGDSSFK